MAGRGGMAAAALALAWATGAAADQRAAELEAAALAIAGDADYGAYLAGECLTCHQASGAAQGIPPVVGWPRGELVAALVAYKFGLRRHPVMETVTSVLGPQELAALATYLGGLAPPR